MKSVNQKGIVLRCTSAAGVLLINCIPILDWLWLLKLVNVIPDMQILTMTDGKILHNHGEIPGGIGFQSVVKDMSNLLILESYLAISLHFIKFVCLYE